MRSKKENAHSEKEVMDAVKVMKKKIDIAKHTSKQDGDNESISEDSDSEFLKSKNISSSKRKNSPKKVVELINHLVKNTFSKAESKSKRDLDKIMDKAIVSQISGLNNR